jgi:hypothetical protein
MDCACDLRLLVGTDFLFLGAAMRHDHIVAN